MSTTMLYRPAETPNEACWGLNVEHQIVPTDDVDGALADGWFRHPNDFPAEGEVAPETTPKRKARAPKGA